MIETVVAFTLFSLVFLFSLTLFSGSSMMSRRGQELAEADNFVQSVLSDYKARALGMPVDVPQPVAAPRPGWACQVCSLRYALIPPAELRELRVVLTIPRSASGSAQRLQRSLAVSAIRR